MARGRTGDVMGKIHFNAYSFLRPLLEQKGIHCRDAELEIRDGETVADLIARLPLEGGSVQAVLVNRKGVPFDTPLFDGDRLALLPPGAPGGPGRNRFLPVRSV